MTEPTTPAGPGPEPRHRYPELPETKSVGARRPRTAEPAPSGRTRPRRFAARAAVPAKVRVVTSRQRQEVLAGRPFVGPAGRVLDKALAKAGMDRETVFLT